MMSKNCPNHHSVSVPNNWNLPNFSLGQRVRFNNKLPQTSLIQTGIIVGMEYFDPENFPVVEDNQQTGWYYYIQVDAEDCWRTVEPVVCAEESDIEVST